MRQPTPPALPGLPILGNLLEFNRDRYGLLQRGYDTLGPIFSLRLGPKRAAVLIGPHYHQRFFEETDHTLSIAQAYKFLVPMFGEPVGVMAPPEDYQKQRPILLELFKSANMEGYVQVMVQEVQAWLATLGASGIFEVVDSCQRLAQHIAAHAFLGAEFRQRLDHAFWHLFHDLVGGMDAVLPPYLPLPRFLRRDRARRQMHAMLRPWIAERRGASGQHQDFLQTLVEARYADGRPLTEALIVSFMTSLMFAGYETTSGQASWGLIHLLQHPAYLRVVVEEQAQVLPPGQPITLETLRHLPHLLWALRETERLCPAAGLLMRFTVAPYEVGGYQVPAGWLTLIAPHLAHRLPAVFHEPAHYDPWRFAPERAEDRQHRFALVGFGGGGHKCLGIHFATNEMAVMISLLLQHYHLELLTPEPQPRLEADACRPPDPMLDSLSAALRPELAAARDTDPEGEQGNAGGNRQSLDRMTRTLHHRFSQPETHSQWWSSQLSRPPGIVGQESSPCERSIPMGACIGCRVRVRSSMSLSASGGCCAAGPRPIACSLTWPLDGRPYGTTSVTTSPCARKCSRSWKVHGRRKKKQS